MRANPAAPAAASITGKTIRGAAIEAILELQTGLFAPFQNSEQLILTATANCAQPAFNNEKLFETIYNCEFIGFIDPEHRRVGCMLHPMVTGGRDLRDHCFYGAEICSGHFCPGYSCFTTAQQRAVVDATSDWYLYGLTITDIDLVKEFFKHVENAIGDSIKEKRLADPAVRKFLRIFSGSKSTGPSRRAKTASANTISRQPNTMWRASNMKQRWGVPPSRFDKILVSLESEFASQDDLHKAEEDHSEPYRPVYRRLYWHVIHLQMTRV